MRSCIKTVAGLGFATAAIGVRNCARGTRRSASKGHDRTPKEATRPLVIPAIQYRVPTAKSETRSQDIEEGLVHRRNLLLHFGLSIRAISRSARIAKASSACISASKTCSHSRS